MVNPPHVSKWILIVLLLLVSLATCVLFIGPRLAFWHAVHVRERLESLRDRAKANPPDTNALNQLIRSMHSRNIWERNAAIAYIGQVGGRAEPAVDDLIQALNGTDPYNQREAANSLGEIGPAARQAIPSLIKAVRTYPDADIGWFAAKSLGQIADPNDATVLTALEQGSKSTNRLMAEDATRALQTLAARGHKPESTNGPAAPSR